MLGLLDLIGFVVVSNVGGEDAVGSCVVGIKVGAIIVGDRVGRNVFENCGDFVGFLLLSEEEIVGTASDELRTKMENNKQKMYM